MGVGGWGRRAVDTGKGRWPQGWLAGEEGGGGDLSAVLGPLDGTAGRL